MAKIDYEELLREASIDVVRRILSKVAKDGFSGKQHLYITFATKHPRVKISKDLKEDDDLTIVLQYEFWDLKIDNSGFSVGLAFDKGDEEIYVPFSALINVSDPSADFDLNFVPDFKDCPKQPIQNVISLADFKK